MEYCKISLKKLSGAEKKPGYHPSAFKELFGSTKVGHYLNISRSDFYKAGPVHSQGMSISGVQQKLSVKENAQHDLEVTTNDGEYILKPSPESHPNAAENEHAAMCVSRALGINTALCGLISFKQDGELAYIIKRFDRLTDGQKLHQEDLLQCLGEHSDNKYAFTYEAAGRCILEVTNGKQALVVDFIRRVITAYMMGNDDLHLKNISVQRSANNKSLYYDKLAPTYDVLFCEAFKSDKDQNKGNKFLALGLLEEEGKGSKEEHFSVNYDYYGFYTGYDFLELGRRLGIAEKPIRNFIDKLNNDENKITDLIRHSYMPVDMSQRAVDMVKARINILQLMNEHQPE